MKTAVVLLNLGGPDSLDAVRPFLFNLFNDRAIINLPQPFRYFLAQFISLKRNKIAQGIYEQLGGKSPIVQETKAQAAALERALRAKGEDARVFFAMRHWHPMTKEVVEEVKDYDPQKVILLPLYPQYSTTTTQSAFDEWYRQARIAGLNVNHHPVCCYPFDAHFIDAHVALLKEAYGEASKAGKPRILFSAHGLPEKIVAKGDPYQWQIERSVAAIMRKFGKSDFKVSYQSRVGRLKWIGPSTEDEIRRAGQDKVPLIVVPIAFVSEHSETLVELDIEYKHLAEEVGVEKFVRVPTLRTQPEFIASLTWLVEVTVLTPHCSNALGRVCPKEFSRCGYREWKLG